MAAEESQVQQSQQLTPIDDYQLSGDDSTVERKRTFLTHYRTHGVIYRAADATHIHRTTVYKWLESDTEFVRAFDDCHQDTYDDLEASGFQKAMAGDPILTMFYLKAHRPKFRDKVAVDIQVIDEEIRERLSALQGQRLLPPMATTEFVDGGNGHHAEPKSLESESSQFPSPSDDLQKD